jgi:hypothetical protein
MELKGELMSQPEVTVIVAEELLVTDVSLASAHGMSSGSLMTVVTVVVRGMGLDRSVVVALMVLDMLPPQRCYH